MWLSGWFEMRRTESRSRVWGLTLIWMRLDQCHMNTDSLEILEWECVSVRQTHASFSAVTRRWHRIHLAWLFLLCWPVFLFSFASVNTHTPLLSITAVLLRHWWGTSGAGFFFRVSIIDWTPRLTLDVTRRVTESVGGGVKESDFPRHFWYRN